MVLSARAKAAVQQLAQDHTAGSAELALRACRIFEKLSAGRSRSSEPTVAQAERCGQVGRAVAGAQPSMAAVLNVSNRWLLAVEQGEQAAVAARRLARELRQAQKTGAALAAELVTGGATVITYSASSTVIAGLLACWRAGRRFRVLCSEARPLLEGRKLANRLAEKGVPVEFFTDAALFSAVSGADLVLVGCDAILSGSFVNKVGTGALQLLARRSGIPFYVLADSFKFLPRSLEPWFRIRPESAMEVWSAAKKNIAVRNVYFEKVPWRGCAGVVTETGVWSPQEIRSFLQRAKIAAGLRACPRTAGAA